MNKHHKLLIAWFLISGLIVFTAVRQIQVAVASDVQAHKPLPPPTKTRHAIRPAVLPWSGDPVADYVARCGKGMTDKEIGWILEDFRSAVLDQFPFTDSATDELLVTYLAAQHRWYHAALVDGLRLSHEQSFQTAKTLAELFKDAETDFYRRPKSGNADTATVPGFENAVPDPWRFSIYGGLTAAEMSMWPWNLCQLSASQERLTWKSWFELLSSPSNRGNEEQTANLRRRFVEKNGQSLFWSQDPVSGSTQAQEAPYWIIEANSILPLLANQKILASPPASDPFAEPAADGGASLLANIRLLHPAQFKLVLLFRPELAGEIEGALEKASR